MKIIKQLIFVLISFMALIVPYVLGWYTNNGYIYNDNNNQTNIRGLSWFGFETPDYIVNGLWAHPMFWYIDKVSEMNFNCFRIPYSSEWILYNFNRYPVGSVSADYSLNNKQSIEILDELFDYTEQKNILIMLDLHRLHKEYISELWYSPTDKQYTAESYFQTWFTVLDRYKNRTNLFAVDLLNEPHGPASWGDNNPSTDWKLFVENAIPKFLERYPNAPWVYFVEGVGWGKFLGNYKDHPFNFTPEVMKKIVFSPHNYGKSVVPGIDMNPYSLQNDWNNNFGFLRNKGLTVVTGEWGGKTEIDTDWMNIFIDYLIQNDMRNSFFWSLGPNSGDVAGLFNDDWTTIDQFKINIINKLQPNPSN